MKKKFDHLIMSPHCDDALLSMGGRILLSSNVKVVTIFGTCAWSTLKQLTNTDEMTKINVQEDQVALKMAGCASELYEFPEVLLRGYRKWNTKKIHTADTQMVQKITNILKSHIPTSANIYFPTAPGNHVDHVIIARLLHTVYPLAQQHGTSIFAYEDLPYAWYGGLQEKINALRGKYRLQPQTLDISSVMDQKIKILQTYKSQLATSDLHKVRNYAESFKGVVYGERIWKIEQK